MFGFGFKMGLNCVQRLAGEVIPPVLTAPSVITAPMWTLADSPSAGGNQLAADLGAFPYDGGSPITELQWRVGAGAAQTLSGLGLGVRLLTVLAGTAADVQLRAGNAIGFGAWSDVKTQTPTVSAPAPMANIVSQGGVSFPFSGAARQVGNAYADAAFIVVPDGQTVPMDAPVPVVTTINVGGTDYTVNGVQKNGLMYTTDAASTTQTPFDQRGAFNAANMATFPASMAAGDVLKKQVHQPDVTVANRRQGTAREFALCAVLSQSTYDGLVAQAPMTDWLAPAPCDWTGRASKTWRRVDLSLLQSKRLGLSLAGLGVPAASVIVARMAKFNFGTGATNSTTESGYENLSPNGWSRGTGFSNYGQTMAETIKFGLMHFMGDTPWAEIEPFIKQWVAMGSWFYDQEVGRNNPVRGDGGHWQFWLPLMVMGLIATDRENLIPTIENVHPGNQLGQSFLLTAPHLAQLVPHSDPNMPYMSRLRTVTAISGLDVSLDVTADDPTWLQFLGLELRKGDGTFIGIVSSGAASNGNAALPYVVTVDRAIVGLSVSDTVYTTIPTAWGYDVGTPAWTIRNAIIGSGFSSFSASPTAVYNSLNYWAGELMFLASIGIDGQSQFGAFKDLVLKQVYDYELPTDMQSAALAALPAIRKGTSPNTLRLISPFSEDTASTTQDADIVSVKNFWDAHAVTLGLTAPVVAPTMVAAMLMGQSEPNAIVSPSAFYQSIPSPTITTPNLAMHTGVGTITRTVVDNAAVVAGNVNPAMSAMSVWLDFIAPGVQFEVGANCVPGTSRVALGEDANTARNFSDLAAMVASVEAAAGGPVKHLIEGWYNSDATYITNFKNNFWPLYFGSNADGSPFTLGTAAPYGSVVDHCIWDAQAASNAKGRGLFTRDDTTWHILAPMPFSDASVDPSPPLDNFSANNGRLSEPARANMELMVSDPIAVTVRAEYGPSLHIVDFTNPFDQIHPHPNPANPAYGVVAYMWPHAIALARAAGVTIHTPKVVGIEGPTDGTYADLVVDLPNGGNLMTNAALEGETYSGTAPHHQAVIGIEMARGSLRKPVMKTSETSYPVEFRGTVTVSDAGSGSPRRGRIRVTPSTPFAFGNSLSLLRGQATASLLEPRDFDLFPWFPIEHIPALYDPTALYPFPGVAVDPFQSDLAVNVPAPAFAARGAYFGGASYFSATTGVSHVAGASGIISAYFRHGGATFTGGQVLFQQRIGSTETLRVSVTTTNRMQLAIQNDSGTTTLSFYSAPGSVPFVVGQYYHLLIDWSAARGGAHIMVNGVEVGVRAFTLPTMNGATITQVGIGATSAAANPWLGDIGHLYINVNETLDMSVLANREKFALGGVPVNLGGNGEIPTGTAPAFYYDGVAGVDWSNKGLAGTISLTGSLTPSVPTPAY